MRLKKLKLIDPKSLNGPGIDLRGSKCIFFLQILICLPCFYQALTVCAQLYSIELKINNLDQNRVPE